MTRKQRMAGKQAARQQDVPPRVRPRTPRPAYSGIPAWVRALAVLAVVVVVLPLLAMVLRVDWAQFLPLVTSASSLTALGLSLRTSAASTLLCIVLGVPLALVLARDTFRLQGLLRSLVLLPLVLPPVVGGIALLYTFGRQGLLGQALNVLGLQIAFSTAAVVLAQTFVALPFLVVSLEGALRTTGSRYEAVAATLGARPGTVFRRVTLPLVLPGLASGAVLSFARSLGEFGATLTFAGSLQGVTRTLPLEIYLQRETDPDAAVALSLVLVAVAVAVVGLAYGRPAAGRSGPGKRTTATAPAGRDDQ
ncbi:ABC transporter permease [Pseudarthrobacter sp. BRE9]|uniref:ABC transporter permease n=1 Tax=Pseudarthrobacter sp. BRE9 TaxID=2962582 RepID=UPI0028818B51|nr:ABC transporter permease [Pseudarthrobacter sp. BRE9]MDT0169387.1 ABC transporter permease [Pseudarthrobacter sp. BRE9]